LHSWGRTHRSDDRGRIFSGVTKLAQKLGCSGENSTRRRRKLVDVVEAVCAAAPDEFTRCQLHQGRTDQVLTLTKSTSFQGVAGQGGELDPINVARHDSPWYDKPA
jgi:hypothetical protein